MTITRCMTLLACSAALALGACSDTKTVPNTAAVEKAQREAADADDARQEAEASLKELRDSLADAQAAVKALGSGTNEVQRANAIKVLTDVERNLGTVRETLRAQPASAAKTLVDTAVEAVGAAVEAVKMALVPTPASGGPVSFADMHTDLDAAQAALDDAQTKIAAALETEPTDALRTALSQAQAMLSTAQISLVPLLRQELREAESDVAELRAYDPRVSLTDALLPVAPGGTQVNRGGTNADFTYMSRTTYTAKIAPSGDALTVSANFAYTDRSRSRTRASCIRTARRWSAERGAMS